MLYSHIIRDLIIKDLGLSLGAGGDSENNFKAGLSGVYHSGYYPRRRGASGHGGF
jgi:hypothetical protein